MNATAPWGEKPTPGRRTNATKRAGAHLVAFSEGRCEVLNNSLISNYQTKLLIMDAADKLVEETPFDKLSVTQICKEAGISRATFYRCFKDKFAIAQWHVELAWAQGANEIGRTLSWKEGYYITEANIASRNLFYAGVAKSNDYNAIDNFAPRLRRKTITETLQMRKVPLTEHLKLQIDATVELEVHLFPKWHYGFYDVSLDEMCEWVADSIPRELFDLLNTPLHPRSSRPPRPIAEPKPHHII